MERIYRKLPDGTFEEAGWETNIDLYDGIWLVQNRPGQRGKTSLVWRVGDLKRPVDVTTKAAFYSILDEVAHYIVQLAKPESEEYKEALKEMDLWITNKEQGIGVFNISADNYAMLILNKISSYFEDVEDPTTFYWATREYINNHYEDREVLNGLIEFLEKSNFVLKKIHKKNGR